MRLLLLALLLFALAGSASAQHLPAALMVRPDTMLAVQPRDPDLRLPAIDQDLYRAERRSRMVLATGLGILLSAAAHTATLATSYHRCGAARNASQYGAMVVGGVGFAVAMGGGTSLALHTRETRYPPTRGQKLAMTFSALGAGVVTQALLFASSGFVEWMCAVSD